MHPEPPAPLEHPVPLVPRRLPEPPAHLRHPVHPVPPAFRRLPAASRFSGSGLQACFRMQAKKASKTRFSHGSRVFLPLFANVFSNLTRMCVTMVA